MKRVALLIETSRSYGRELLRGVHRYIEHHRHWSVFVELRALESRPPAWLHSWDGDGVLVRSGSKAVADAVDAAGVPAVELRATRLNRNVPFVGIDNRAVGAVCAQHLLDLGLRSFGVYQLDTETFFTDRCSSFVAALQTRGYPCRVLRQSGRSEKPAEWDRQQGRLIEWLQQLKKPAGVLACTDQLGFWLLDACLRAGISVPDEVAVIGVENDETLCNMSSPPLTSLNLGGERIGYEAATLLDRLMKGGKPPRGPMLFPPGNLAIRRSTDVVATDDPLISLALRRVRDQATQGLRVSDLLKQVPLSRSALERGFRQILGRSPNQELMRVRLERTRVLLAETDLTLSQIAHRAGFTQPHYFSHCFRKFFGQTPGQYRKAFRVGR